MRQDPRTAHVPILIVTALHGRAAMLTGIRAGANDFLIKPIEAEELRLRVKNAMWTKHLYDKVQEHSFRVEELQSLQDRLTNLIVHHMRSPLMALSESLELLLDDEVQLSKAQQEYHTMGSNPAGSWSAWSWSSCWGMPLSSPPGPGRSLSGSSQSRQMPQTRPCA
jgi:response regulator RpfG family c-di-GMP phosphodiesterase